jgi:hypothetical protein
MGSSRLLALARASKIRVNRKARCAVKSSGLPNESGYIPLGKSTAANTTSDAGSGCKQF